MAQAMAEELAPEEVPANKQRRNLPEALPRREIVHDGIGGPYDDYVAGISWDLCTGRGSLLGGLRLYTAGATPVN